MNKQIALNRFVILLIIVLSSIIAYAEVQPSAPTSIVNSSPISPSPSVGGMLNTSGGTITTVNINATTQNPRWKGLVGNISGNLALQDNASNSLISWDIVTVTGEIYATRNTSIPDWDSVVCATDQDIEDEEFDINITGTNPDSIQNTFSETTHDAFYAGISQLTADSCYSTALNVNSSEQSTYFQQVLLSDGPNLIHTALLENSTYGFNNQTYDFQMVLPDNGLDGTQTSIAYYFYVELI